MPRRYKLQLRNVQNVSASKTVLIDVPIGRRIHSIHLQHGYAGGTNTAAGAALNITEARLRIDGRTQRTFSGTQLRDMNLLNGVQYDFQGLPNTAPGVTIPIYLTEPWRKSVGDALAMSLPTQWVGGKFSTVQLEVDLGAAATPTLVAYAIVDDVIPALKSGQNFPFFTKWLRLSVAAAGTSFDISTIDKKDILLQISLYPDSGAGLVASRVTLRKDGEILSELTPSVNAAILVNNDLAPAAANRTALITDVVLDYDDLFAFGEDLGAARELTMTVEAATAMSGTVTAIIQRVGPPE